MFGSDSIATIRRKTTIISLGISEISEINYFISACPSAMYVNIFLIAKIILIHIS